MIDGNRCVALRGDADHCGRRRHVEAVKGEQYKTSVIGSGFCPGYSIVDHTFYDTLYFIRNISYF